MWMAIERVLFFRGEHQIEQQKLWDTSSVCNAHLIAPSFHSNEENIGIWCRGTALQLNSFLVDDALNNLDALISSIE